MTSWDKGWPAREGARNEKDGEFHKEKEGWLKNETIRILFVTWHNIVKRKKVDTWTSFSLLSQNWTNYTPSKTREWSHYCSLILIIVHNSITHIDAHFLHQARCEAWSCLSKSRDLIIIKTSPTLPRRLFVVDRVRDVLAENLLGWGKTHGSINEFNRIKVARCMKMT